MAPRLPDADHVAQSRLIRRGISRFPCNELPHMPGSSTTPGHPGTRAYAPVCVAFHLRNSVGTRDMNLYEAQWLAYVLPQPPSRTTTHGPGPMWIATPSLRRTSTDYSLPISRRTAKDCVRIRTEWNRGHRAKTRIALEADDKSGRCSSYPWNRCDDWVPRNELPRRNGSHLLAAAPW